MGDFFGELQRRKLFNKAGVYLVAAWLATQVTDVTSPALGFPSWSVTFVIYFFALTFPFAMVYFWALEGERIAHYDSEDSPPIALINIQSPLFALALAIVSAMGFVSYRIAAPVLVPIPSVAVMPFVNLTGDQTQEYLADGITDEILNNLFKIDGLKVIGRTSVFSLKNSGLDISQISERLSVDHVLEGTVQRDSQDIRLTARLINAETGLTVWSDQFDGQLVNFETQSRIVSAVVNGVAESFSLKSPIVSEAPSRFAEAQDLYLRGRYYLENRRQSQDTDYLALARENFDAAVKIDPLYADAWAGYGLARIFENELDLAVQYFVRALEIDVNHSSALMGLGTAYWRLGRLEEAYNNVSHALALSPGNGEIRHFYSGIIASLGHFEEALEQQKLAAELNPIYPSVISSLGQRYQYLWRWDEAIEVYERAQERGLDFDRGIYDHLFRSYGNAGRYDDAWNAYLRLEPNSENSDSFRFVLNYYRGDSVSARSYYEAEIKESILDPEAQTGAWALWASSMAGDLDTTFLHLNYMAENDVNSLIRILRYPLGQTIYQDARWLEFWERPELAYVKMNYDQSRDAPWYELLGD